MEKKNLYNQAVLDEILTRLAKIESNSTPDWGKMTAAQMLAHCAEVQEVTNGKALKNTPFMVKVFKGLIKAAVISDKSYPKGSKTHPQYIQKEDKDFNQEKNRLVEALNKFHQNPEAKVEHPLFGAMTHEEKGWAMYKHLDHHLNQFGV